MSEQRWTIWRCPECGEVEREEASASRWSRVAGGVTHRHPGEKPHWPGKEFPAEEVEVAPVTELQSLEERLGEAEAKLREIAEGFIPPGPHESEWRSYGGPIALLDSIRKTLGLMSDAEHAEAAGLNTEGER